MYATYLRELSMIHEANWKKPTAFECHQWAMRAIPFFEKIKLKAHYPFVTQSYGPYQRTIQWKVIFVCGSAKIKKHDFKAINFKLISGNFFNPHTPSLNGGETEIVKFVKILSEMMGEVPVPDPKDRYGGRDLDLLMTLRSREVFKNVLFKETITRLANEYQAILDGTAEQQALRMIKGRAEKNEAHRKKAFSKRFENKEQEVLNKFAELAILTGTEDNVASLKIIVNIMNSNLLDSLVRFRSENRATLNYLDENRLAEACKLALFKKTMET